jgi:hypothetical protein
MKNGQPRNHPLSLTPPAPARLALAGALLLAIAQSGLAQTPNILTDHYTYLPGEPIVAAFSGGPGNPNDWIGVYPLGVEPGSVASTIWLYTDGTGSGDKGLVEGAVTFEGGLTLAGDWVAYLLLDDGYTKLAQVGLRVVDPSEAYVRLNKRGFTNGEPLSISFTNGPGNAKDWIGVYPENRLPGNGTSLLWKYVDGTTTGNAGITENTIAFPSGLPVGSYIAYLLANDGYDIVASEPFVVREPVTDSLRLLSMSPANNASNVPPFAVITATIRNGTRKLDTNSVVLSLDGQPVTHTLVQSGDDSTVSFTNPVVLPPNSAHTATLRFADNATPAKAYTNTVAFTIITYTNVLLNTPIYFEDFESTAEGGLPAGWTSTSYTTVNDENFDLQDLNSKSYADWVVVSRDRFTNSFLSYDGHTPTTDYLRVLSQNPLNIVNGQLVKDLASGHFAFNTSGYRSGSGQYAVLQTKDYDLTGKTNIHLAFHSLWEQNQDSIAAVEYSFDGGTSWLPIVYMLHQSDVIRFENGDVDAVTTLSNEYGDLARYTDLGTGEEKGGTYGAYIGAPVTAGLAPYISGRVDDDAVESKRVEVFRLPQADNQSKVRLRFAHSGTDSWYFGIDNVGLYSFGSQPTTPVNLTIVKEGNGVRISWPADAAGYQLETAPAVPSAVWSTVPGVTGNSILVPIEAGAHFYRLRK